MRFHRVPLLLACTAFIAIAAAAYSCGIYGEEQAGLAAAVKVPGRISRSVIRGNLLIALLADNRLVSVELTTGATKTLATFDEPAGALDAANNKVCIASKNRVMIFDLADGKMTQAAACDYEVDALGFLASERVYVQSGSKICVLDLSTGKTIHNVSLGKDNAKLANRGYRTLGRSGNQLFVSVASENDAVAVFDLGKGEVIDRISAAELRFNSSREHPTDMLFAGDNVYVLSSRFGYGVWTERLGVIDLKTRAYTAIKLPGNGMQGPSLKPGPDGTVFLTTFDGTYHFDASGKQSATVISPTDARAESMLLGVWQGKALVAYRQELRQVPMSATTAQSH